MTREQKIELCKQYNGSDIGALLYMKQFVNTEQKPLLDRLFELNEKCIENDNWESGELDEYYNGKWKLLSSFGIENDMGDALFEGVMYQ